MPESSYILRRGGEIFGKNALNFAQGSICTLKPIKFHSREGEIFRQNFLDSGGVGSIATLKISPIESTA